MQCPFCGAGQLRRETQTVTYEYAGQVVSVKQLGDYCVVCGEALLSPADLEATRASVLKALLPDVTPENTGPEIDFGPPVGREFGAKPDSTE